jgi:FkbM family methyltransferase
LALLEATDIPCLGIIDRKFTAGGEGVSHAPHFHPDTLKAGTLEGKPVIVALHSPATDTNRIVESLRALSAGEVLTNADIPDLLGPSADNYWLTNRAFTLDAFEQIRTVARKLADPLSVETLFALARYRITGRPSECLYSCLTEQYTPPGLLHFERPITFVDGGAFRGDTFQHFQSRNIPIETWIAFEPDPENFQALSDFAKTHPTRAILMPCGLSDRLTEVPFFASAGMASRLADDDTASFTVPCVALDSVIRGFQPDYIKLDIEGAERAALLGMQATLSNARPCLAVSGYHRPEDLWELVDLTASLLPHSQIYLRQHGLNGFDTVIYAIPSG